MKTHEFKRKAGEHSCNRYRRRAGLREIERIAGGGASSQKGYIDINEYDEITLTKTGFAKAAHIYERHRVISELLIRMGADEVLAEENACRIEHVITPELFGIIKEYLKK